jgi:hypothetical protein
MDHFYIIYKTINKINNKFYIGMHKTSEINDGYLGSGNLIKAAIKKYGIENFSREVLHVFTKLKDAINKEKELITEDLLCDPLCYNLTLGGRGGFHHIKKQNKHTSCKNKKIIHHKVLNITTKVNSSDLQKYLLEGWEFGFLPSSLEKMSAAGKVKIQTEEHRKKNSESKKDALLLENILTKKRKFVKKILVEEYLNNGWKVYPFRTKRK